MPAWSCAATKTSRGGQDETAKGSTASLQAVCDWPELVVCWPEGVVPISLAAGFRYKQGVIIYERFSFAVVVP